ncbi:zinc finger protein 704-like [Acanthaster planci]|uniref:Zinc finger protein 704-like n=1 Tax=Acanthaster planci TaxID=133434 RepID=A0A8B7Z726_ACAPL|nr:zinc finger protein 704-like [Acanthaster planci]
MYGSKRLAKRSIVGTRVCAPWPDGIYYPGIIRNVENQTYYTICFDDGYIKVYREADIVGQGFRGVCSIHLKFGQKVYITNNGREMVGHVQKHKKPTNEVFIKIADSSETMIQRKLDEVRLMESRKSPRLADHETNYLKLADMSPTSDAKKRNVSSSIDVPSAKSFKIEEEPLMDDVMAAMVLTSLSGSPRTKLDSSSVPYSPISPIGGATCDLSTGTASSYSPSSSGHFSWDFHSRGTPSPTSSNSDVECNVTVFSYPEIGSTNGVNFDQLSVDEGIDMSEVGALCTIDDIPAKKLKVAPTRTMYKCTWPGCGKKLSRVQGIEKHIRSQHLRTKDTNSSCSDHEEEFYYTEVETTVDSMSDMFADMNTSSPPPAPGPTDMVRHTREDLRDNNGNNMMCLDRVMAQMESVPENSMTMVAPHGQVPQQTTFTWQTTHPASATLFQTNGQYSSPIRTKTSIVQQRQQLHQAASPKTHLHFAPSSTGSGSASSLGHHKTREGKKCRKVYGMERKDLWCTQCRWKKACVRFTS